MSEHDHRHEPPRTTEQAAAGTTPPAPPANPNPAVLEEAGSRALSEALRSSFVIVKVLMIGLVILFFASGVFTVPSQERAIVLRFGRPVGTGDAQLLGPGLHWSFPRPIDEIVRIPTGEIQSITSSAGWYQTTPEAEATKTEPEPNATLNPATDGYTITSDGNIIHTRATIRYRINDPLQYVLNFINASNVVQSTVDNALFWASSQYTVTRALQDQLGFQDLVVQRVRDLIDQHKLGIVVEGAVVQVIPPRQTKQAFEQVSVAEIERRKAQDDAQAYAARLMSTSQGEAAALINQGRTHANATLQRVASEASYFTNQLAYYEANPELFRSRLQAEAMNRILAQNQGKVFTLPSAKAGEPAELRLLLNRAPLRRPQPAEQQR